MSKFFLSNEVLWILFLILDLSVALILFRLFGKLGIFVLIAISIILCNIQVTKLVTLFGFTATLGNVLYGSLFFSTDILSEFYGKREARKGVVLGFIALLMTAVYMQLSLRFKPAPDDFAQPHLKVIFGFLPRIALGSILAYLASQYHDVWAFHHWKRVTHGRHLWLRNNFSTMVSQFIDSLIFCFIAFWGVYSFAVWKDILLTTYFLKWAVALLDTPFIYFARHLYRKDNKIRLIDASS